MFEVDDDGEGEAGEGEAALDRRVVQDVLQVERQQEELRERDRADDRHRGVRAGERARAEDPQRQQRVGRAQLDQHEGPDERGRDAEEPERAGRAPAVARRAGGRVDEQHQAAGDRGRAARRRSAGARGSRGRRAGAAASARSAAIPTGTLMKKTHDQLRYEVSTPPSSTPTAAPEPEAAP